MLQHVPASVSSCWTFGTRKERSELSWARGAFISSFIFIYVNIQKNIDSLCIREREILDSHQALTLTNCIPDANQVLTLKKPKNSFSSQKSSHSVKKIHFSSIYTSDKHTYQLYTFFLNTYITSYYSNIIGEYLAHAIIPPSVQVFATNWTALDCRLSVASFPKLKERETELVRKWVKRSGEEKENGWLVFTKASRLTGASYMCWKKVT